jgi:hypothetical protein
MSKSRKPRVRTFAASRITLWIATLVLAAFGAVGWGIALWEVSQPLAVMGAAVALVAPLAAAALTGPAAHGAGLSAWLAILIFTAMDAGSNANAAWQFDAAANAAVNGPATEQHAADLAAAKATLASAQAALIALPTPDANGAIRKAETYQATHAALSANVATAKAALDALKAPEPVQLFPRWLSGTVMALTSLALIFGHLAVNTAARKEHERARLEAPAPRSKRKRKPRAKAPAPVTQPQGNVTPIRRPPRQPVN